MDIVKTENGIRTTDTMEVVNEYSEESLLKLKDDINANIAIFQSRVDQIDGLLASMDSLKTEDIGVSITVPSMIIKEK